MKKLWKRIRTAFYSWIGGFVQSADSDCYGEGWEAESEPASPVPVSAAAGPETPAATPDAARLDFKFGGVKANPAEDARCRISGVKFTQDGLSFIWMTGIPADWKRGDTGKGPMVLACAFYRDAASGVWTGGKFDWIDETRTTRSFSNIKDGYHGWPWEKFDSAARRAFCVVSADGKYRSNLLEA